jgi:lysyl-tRNA synthetase class I
MTDPQHDREPAEHQRYAHYLQALDAVSEAEEADLVAAVLRDQDVAMAQGAVVHHLDRRAAQLLTDTDFTAWVHIMVAVIGDRDFLTRRLREWTLLRTIALNEPWAAEELTAASDWFQRTAATTQIITSPDALSQLAERGRTRRVRNAASRRMERLDQPPN